MFSGLIAYRATVISNHPQAEGGAMLVLSCEAAKREGVQPKDSIAINGVCLTATRVNAKRVQFDVVPETIARSTLASLREGDVANLEYSLRVGDRMGGHFVYGHVDATAAVMARTPEGQGERVRVERPHDLAPMIVEKAFIAVDGVSLTVAAIGENWFEIALIPETLARTTLGNRPVGSRVNLEVDPLARYAYSVHAATCHPEPPCHPELVEGHPEPNACHPELVEGHPEPNACHPELVEG
jgi:riboflavin synthase